MIEFLGEEYYIDFKEIDKFLISDKSFEEGVVISEETTYYFDSNNTLTTQETTETKSHKNKEINGVRYDIIRSFINDLGDSDESEDVDSIGRINKENLSVRFKLAFNTLLYYKILKKLN